MVTKKFTKLLPERPDGVFISLGILLYLISLLMICVDLVFLVLTIAIPLWPLSFGSAGPFADVTAGLVVPLPIYAAVMVSARGAVARKKWSGILVAAAFAASCIDPAAWLGVSRPVLGLVAILIAVPYVYYWKSLG